LSSKHEEDGIQRFGIGCPKRADPQCNPMLETRREDVCQEGDRLPFPLCFLLAKAMLFSPWVARRLTRICFERRRERLDAVPGTGDRGLQGISRDCRNAPRNSRCLSSFIPRLRTSKHHSVLEGSPPLPGLSNSTRRKLAGRGVARSISWKASGNLLSLGRTSAKRQEAKQRRFGQEQQGEQGEQGEQERRRNKKGTSGKRRCPQRGRRAAVQGHVHAV